ncbi:MAG: hypothetical protein C3F12_09100 [Candidatus Methylomirabilota bacterium]|nr:hypothetical protein [Candidatus Methylomirabilis sp.]NJD68910.1 hypothetical protein [candidate division NC10 bacterium]PWB46194.1 MAG: hypothetical protein C3F12_09100 [candidate division NC10 bacterium]
MANEEQIKTSIPEPDAPETIERLKAIVREHRVCWEVWPEQLAGAGYRPLQVGFDLVLNGAHAHEDRPSAGCEKCKAIFEHLRQIAEWIMPKVERPSRYDIQIFDHAIHFAPERGNRPDVALTIKILHRVEIGRPVDECEVRCLDEMKAKLAQIGAQHRQWVD